MMEWHLEGKLKYRVDVVSGLENAPKALAKLFDGSNTGKLLVQDERGVGWRRIRTIRANPSCLVGGSMRRAISRTRDLGSRVGHPKFRPTLTGEAAQC